MRRFTLAALALCALTATAAAQPVYDEPFTDCTTIGFLGAGYAAAFRADMHDDIAGYTHRISSLKTLVVNGVDRVSVRGCRLEATLDVTLRRRVRRNAHGTMTAHATITEIDLTEPDVVRICVADPDLDRVRLSNTLRLGEAVYRWIANLALPDAFCAELPR